MRLGVALCYFNINLPSSMIIEILALLFIGFFSNWAVIGFSIVEAAWVLTVLTLLAGIGQAFENNALVRRVSWVGRNSLVLLVLFLVVMKLFKSNFTAVDSSGSHLFSRRYDYNLNRLSNMRHVLDLTRTTKFLFGINDIYKPFQM